MCYEVRFEDVCFGYDRDRQALSHVSLTLKPGTLTAFVDPSGAGKTTAAQLIGRYWDTDSGTISIGGIPLQDIDSESLMDLTAFVFQDVFLMENTLFENIRICGSGQHNFIFSGNQRLLFGVAAFFIPKFQRRNAPRKNSGTPSNSLGWKKEKRSKLIGCFLCGRP